MYVLRFGFLGLVLLTVSCSHFDIQGQERSGRIRLGIEQFCEQGAPESLKGAKIGLITNHTGVDSRFQSTIDLLIDHPDVELVRLFGPEHGIRGEHYGGGIENATDEKTGLLVYSLYGRYRTPEEEFLEGLDALFYDIQDVGSRGYTYISTMVNAMKVCAKMGIRFVVLDRPNPLGGNRVEGNILESEFKSFVGVAEIPYVYGLTPGELARWVNAEWDIGADLTVILLDGWQRDMTWEQTGLSWVPSSPHVPHGLTCYHLVITGILGELHAVNEGVGTPMPFEVIGAPWIDRDALARELNALGLPGVLFRATTFIPRYHIYAEEVCHGVQMHLLRPQEVDTFEAALAIMAALHKL